MVIDVEVIYALPDQQQLIPLKLPEGSTLRDAIEASGLMGHHLELTWDDLKVGIFGQPATLDVVVESGDRVEIYRPLQMDPKEARRQRAAAKASRDKR